MRAWTFALCTIMLDKVSLPCLHIPSPQNVSLYGHMCDTEPFVTWGKVATKTGGKGRGTEFFFAPIILSKQLGRSPPR